MAQDYEKLGFFYLGRPCDPGTGETLQEPLLYESRDLTTHAVCLGMTGSGKTGLCVGLLEEAAIDGIPALVIDPKGDLGNLLLTFPALAPEDFVPWVDTDEAARRGMSPAQFAAATADSWRKGLADWGQTPDRIARLREAADMTIYTPGSPAGVPLSILRSFAVPSAETLADSSALRDRVTAAVSGLLGLAGVAADPVRSREHILLATILDRAWRENRGMDVAGMITAIQKPGFDKVGVFDLETFYPARDRMELAMALNNLLAAPGFASWMEGEPLDIQRLLYTPQGKPRIAVVSIAHLSDPERMFVVTLLLNEVLSWMRAQSGTTSLRALLYMDEIFGYFPPSSMPPSKLPMLTLLKQARAFGLGVVLATQNPVDLDYKGLANTGTWMIGRLQTDRDRARVMDGLESALSGGVDRQQLESLLNRLGNRTFLLHNVHDEQPVLFRSRWTLSYLRGPMTPRQIQTVMAAKHKSPGPQAPAPVAAGRTETSSAVAARPDPAASQMAAGKPVPPPTVAEYFVEDARRQAGPTCRPHVAGVSQLHFADAKAGVDTWVSYVHLAPVDEAGGGVEWSGAQILQGGAGVLGRTPAPGAKFQELPAVALRAQNYEQWGKSLKTWLYQNVTLDLLACPGLKLVGTPAESEGDFRVRVSLCMRERRDGEMEKLRQRYAPKLAALQEQLRRAEARVEAEKSQMQQQAVQTAISIGATVLGALFGRRAMNVGNVGRAATAMRGASRTARERGDVARAGETVAAVQERLQALQAEFDAQAESLRADSDPALAEIVRMTIRPRKTDITVTEVALAWVG